MSARMKDWIKGSFASWAAAILLGLLSYLGRELHQDVRRLNETLVADREKFFARISTMEARMSMVEYKMDLLTRSFSEFKRLEKN